MAAFRLAAPPDAPAAGRARAALKRRCGKIIQRLLEFAAALGKKDSGSIQLIGGLRSGKQRRVKCLFFGELLGARLAAGQMRFYALALVLADFFANIKNQKRSDILAARSLFKGTHRKPPNSLRSLRVARNSEFFTVSSVVPSASPMARSFRP